MTNEATSRNEGRCYVCGDLIDPDVHDGYIDTPGLGIAHEHHWPPAGEGGPTLTDEDHDV